MFDLQPWPPDYQQQRCQLCSSKHSPRTHLTDTATDTESVRIMNKPGDPYSDESVHVHECVCVCASVYVCVCLVGLWEQVYNRFSPQTHQSKTRSHSLPCNNLLLSSSLPVAPSLLTSSRPRIVSSLCPPSSVDEWFERGIDGEMNGWWMNGRLLG